ncbi:MAG: hypothetical protein GY780_04000 [bacterium]|nr:hypothetical protein [bacterium]
MSNSKGNEKKTLLINLINNEAANAGKALRVGRKFLAADWQVSLSINIDGVKLLEPSASGDLCPVAGKSMIKLMKIFMSEGGQILVGKECLSVFGLSVDHLIEGMEIAQFPMIEELLSRPEVRTMTW